MKFLFLFLILIHTAFANAQYSNLMCTLSNNTFKLTFDHRSWTKEVMMYPWSVQHLECGKNAAAALVDNSFMFFSVKQNRISQIKVQSLDNENVQIAVGDDVAALIVNNYLRVDSSKSTYEHYFDSLSKKPFLSIYNGITAVIYGSNFVVVNRGTQFQYEFGIPASSQDKLLNANYGFAVKRGNLFLVYDKFRAGFKSIKLRVSGKLLTLGRVPTYVQDNGQKIIYNAKTATFDNCTDLQQSF